MKIYSFAYGSGTVELPLDEKNVIASKEKKRYRCVRRKANRIDTVFSLEVTPGFESPRGDFALC